MRKPARKEALYQVQWQEQYTYRWASRPDLPEKTVVRSHSKRYHTRKTAMDHVEWLNQRLSYVREGGRLQGYVPVEGSIKLWRAPVGEWEEVNLENG